MNSTQRCGLYDQIDVNACKKKGTSKPLYFQRSFTHTSCPKGKETDTCGFFCRIFSKALSLRVGRWKSDHSSTLAFDLTGKTLAILGFGGIGFRLAELAHAFPMRIIYFLSLADVLSVQIPLRPDTEGLVGEASGNSGRARSS